MRYGCFGRAGKGEIIIALVTGLHRVDQFDRVEAVPRPRRHARRQATALSISGGRHSNQHHCSERDRHRGASIEDRDCDPMQAICR